MYRLFNPEANYVTFLRKWQFERLPLKEKKQLIAEGWELEEEPTR